VPMKHPCLSGAEGRGYRGAGSAEFVLQYYHVLRCGRGEIARPVSLPALAPCPAALCSRLRHSLRCLDTDDDNRLPGHRRWAT
jgi:hypothetical protein